MNDESNEFSQYPNFWEELEEGENELDPVLDDAESDIIECPYLPLRDLVLYPQMVMPLFIGRDKSLAAVYAAAKSTEEGGYRDAFIKVGQDKVP